jgi:hypothetical protein
MTEDIMDYEKRADYMTDHSAVTDLQIMTICTTGKHVTDHLEPTIDHTMEHPAMTEQRIV